MHNSKMPKSVALRPNTLAPLVGGVRAMDDPTAADMAELERARIMADREPLLAEIPLLSEEYVKEALELQYFFMCPAEDALAAASAEVRRFRRALAAATRNPHRCHGCGWRKPTAVLAWPRCPRCHIDWRGWDDDEAEGEGPELGPPPVL